jgi:hypothetical protein
VILGTWGKKIMARSPDPEAADSAVVMGAASSISRAVDIVGTDLSHHIIIVLAPTGPFMESTPIWYGEGWLPAIASHMTSEKLVSKKYTVLLL